MNRLSTEEFEDNGNSLYDTVMTLSKPIEYTPPRVHEKVNHGLEGIRVGSPTLINCNEITLEGNIYREGVWAWVGHIHMVYGASLLSPQLCSKSKIALK